MSGKEDKESRSDGGVWIGGGGKTVKENSSLSISFCIPSERHKMCMHIKVHNKNCLCHQEDVFIFNNVKSKAYNGGGVVEESRG